MTAFSSRRSASTKPTTRAASASTRLLANKDVSSSSRPRPRGGFRRRRRQKPPCAHKPDLLQRGFISGFIFTSSQIRCKKDLFLPRSLPQSPHPLPAPKPPTPPFPRNLFGAASPLSSCSCRFSRLPGRRRASARAEARKSARAHPTRTFNSFPIGKPPTESLPPVAARARGAPRTRVCASARASVGGSRRFRERPQAPPPRRRLFAPLRTARAP